MKYLTILFITLLFIGCNMQEASMWDYFVFDDIKFESYDEVNNWIRINIISKLDDPNYDRWKNPQATLHDMNGDCEDKALLFIAIVYYQFGVKGNICGVKTPLNQNPYLISNHAVARIGNTIYENNFIRKPSYDVNDYYPVVFEIKFDNLIYWID